jgi:hypothetical protein
MYITRLNLVGSGGAVPAAADAELVRDILWQHASPETGVQHITVTAMPYGLDVVFFFTDRKDLKGRSLEVVGLASAASGVLRDWRVLSAIPPLIARFEPDDSQQISGSWPSS